MSRLVAKVLLSVDKAAEKRTEDISTFLEAVESKNPQISPASPSDFEKLVRALPSINIFPTLWPAVNQTHLLTSWIPIRTHEDAVEAMKS